MHSIDWFIIAGLAPVLVTAAACAGSEPTAGTASPGAAPRPFIRPATPRIAPVEPRDWTESQRQIAGLTNVSGGPTNFMKTTLRHPDLAAKWWPFTRHVAGSDSTLPPRDKELVILRTLWLSHNDYDWTYHVEAGRRAGLTDDDLARMMTGPRAPGLASFDAVLLRAADSLHRDQFIDDSTWAALAGRYDQRQLLDLIFAVGQYTLVSMVTNSVGVQLMPGWSGLPRHSPGPKHP